jgi:hypothetical protein
LTGFQQFYQTLMRNVAGGINFSGQGDFIADFQLR